jgi:predicted transcriptional regulator
MSAVKEQIAAIVARQPDDSTFDEILREIAFARMIQVGLEDADAGRVISDEEMEKEIASWRK